jgi:hypothetical protein
LVWLAKEAELNAAGLQGKAQEKLLFFGGITTGKALG